jgi:hypothetical protein
MAFTYDSKQINITLQVHIRNKYLVYLELKIFPEFTPGSYVFLKVSLLLE